MVHLVWRFSLRIAAWLCGSTCVAAALLAGCLLVWRAEGQHVWAVQTNSMRPTFQAGDALLVNSKRRTRPLPGQIVSYRSAAAGNVLISHRLINVNNAKGTVTTQGDALPAPDPPFPTGQIAGTVTAVLPGFGRLLNTMRRPYALAVFVYVPALSLMVREVWRVAGRTARHAYSLPERLK